MVFATDREIGLQLMPLDGNPYKIVGMIGHPQKVRHSIHTFNFNNWHTRIS